MTVKRMAQVTVAFACGFLEFRSDVTRHYADRDLLLAYDRGRDFAHRVTFRRWDA